MYQFLFSSHFQKKYVKLLKSNPKLKVKMELFFISLEKNPFDVKLKTHKVQSKIVDKAWSSRISGDLRVIWDFNQDKIGVINLLDIGGHSGKNKVYQK